MPGDYQDFEKWQNQTQLEPMTNRQSFNRNIGLCAYAASVVLAVLLLFGIFDELRSRGISGLKDGIQSLGIVAAAMVILWAIGFTTGRRPAR